MDTYENKICQWLTKQFKKFQSIEKIDDIPKISKDRTEIINAFKHYLQVLTESLKKSEKQD